MKKIHEFQTYEVNITEEKRNELCQKIKDIAESQNIMTEPHIQFNLLLKKINIRMIEFCDDWMFTFKNEKSGQIEEVDFSTNSIMFSVKVLKSLFSNNKSGMYTLQSKNLDILSFYANDNPWANKSIHNISNGASATKLRKFDKFAITSCFVLLILIIIFLIFKINNANKEFEIKENRYQFALKLSQKYYYKVYDINNNPMQIPDSSLILFQIYFNDDTSFEIPGGYKMKLIKNKGDFIEEPGIKDNKVIGTPKAFGFGKTDCKDNCYEPEKNYLNMKNCSILRIILPKEFHISYFELNWVEMGYNNGSSGKIHINENSKPFGLWQNNYIGVLPPSNYLIDESVHRLVLKIDTLVKTIDIAVIDIANESEIFVNEIKAYTKLK